jgi:ribosome-binding ATPase YchF (GTP1/OBG family)
VANISEADLKTPSLTLTEFEKWCRNRGILLVKISSRVEAELNELSKEERDDFMKELGMPCSGLVQLIRCGYELLGLITFFTIGDKEIRAWTIPKGTYASHAAGKIHTDFERGFIAAETVHVNDFIHCEGEQGAREQGKLRLEGKNYAVQDGDIIKFRFNV